MQTKTTVRYLIAAVALVASALELSRFPDPAPTVFGLVFLGVAVVVWRDPFGDWTKD